MPWTRQKLGMFVKVWPLAAVNEPAGIVLATVIVTFCSGTVASDSQDLTGVAACEAHPSTLANASAEYFNVRIMNPPRCITRARGARCCSPRCLLNSYCPVQCDDIGAAPKCQSVGPRAQALNEFARYRCASEFQSTRVAWRRLPAVVGSSR